MIQRHGSDLFAALVEGAALARSLGTSCPACSSVAPQILCFAQRFWNPNQNYIVSNSKPSTPREFLQI